MTRDVDVDREWLSPLRTAEDAVAARAFEAMFTAYAQRLAAFAYGYVRSADSARDVTHDVFVRVWAQRRSLPEQGLMPYLFRATRNRALDVLKHEGVVAEWEAYVVLEHGGEPSEANAGVGALEAEGLAERIRAAMRRLSPRVQEIVRLHREEELSPGEIAELLGLAPATVYSQLSRALKQLGEALRG